MGRRHHGHKFMPGKFVFPGGRLERSDGNIRSCSELQPVVAERLAARCVRRSELRGRALALTAIRETYEETGLLVGRPGPEGHLTQPGHPAWRPFLDSGIVPDLGPISFIGRAITPPRRPKRFDTRFFCVDRTAVSAEHDGFVGPDKELIELAWVDLKAAQKLDLPRITSIMLEELEHRLAASDPEGGPVPFYRESRGRFLRETL